MLLGCCHCESESSSSSNPPSTSSSNPSGSSISSSGGSSSSVVSTDTTCNICENSISPLRFRLTHSPTLFNYPCAVGTGASTGVADRGHSHSLYSGNFVLHKSSACNWDSNEKAVEFLATGQVYTLNHRRFGLSISKTTPGGIHTITLNLTISYKHIRLANTFNPQTLEYGPPIDCSSAQNGDGTSPSTVTYRKVILAQFLDCLASVTLDLFSRYFGAGSNPNSTQFSKLAYGNIPVDDSASLPTSVSIEAF